jgi:hypothetical protein
MRMEIEKNDFIVLIPTVVISIQWVERRRRSVEYHNNKLVFCFLWYAILVDFS